jgi:hypothetical protein
VQAGRDFPARRDSGIARDIPTVVLRVLWHLVRLPVFALLIMAAPLVRLVLGGLSLLSLLAALFYEFFSALPHPPFWSLLGFAAACGLTLLLYERLLRLFS